MQQDVFIAQDASRVAYTFFVTNAHECEKVTLSHSFQLQKIFFLHPVGV